MKVAVIFGGTSSEKDVSVKTGQAVIKACMENNYDVQALTFNNDYKKFLPILKKVDVVFNALHGTFGEDGVLQSWLEKNNILFTGSDSISSALCMNKIECKKIIKANDMLTPDWIEMRERSQIPKSFFPCIVKPNTQGSTFGLSLVDDVSSLKKAILNSQKYGKDTLIEKFISGREITVGILGKNPLPIVEIFPKHQIYDYNCKYTVGMAEYSCPANINDKLKHDILIDSVKIFDLLGCSGYGRIDYIIDEENNYHFLELNTLPGMTSTSLLPIAAKAHGITLRLLIKKIIELALDTK